MKSILAMGILMVVGAAVFADESAVFFDDTQVPEIHIFFDDTNWYETLYDSHAKDPEDPYFPARFVCGEVELDPVGVRFKGNSSFGRSIKNPFKIDFDEFDEGKKKTTFMGLKKLNLNNMIEDPTCLREKLFVDFAGRYLPTIRAVHANVYINDVYWGLYLAVEQVDATLVERHFGDEEDGELFEAQSENNDGDPLTDLPSDLTWLGQDPAPYHERYQLKTNESRDNYADLVNFIDILNNAPTAELSARIEAVCDVENMLTALALNALFVNLDSYNGGAHNYYLYHRTGDGKFMHFLWDAGGSFGLYSFGMSRTDNAITLDPFWLPDPALGEQSHRPLMTQLWAVDAYRTYYENMLSRMLSEGFDEVTMGSRIRQLADLIRTHVYADPHKPFSNEDFEKNLTDNLDLMAPALFQCAGSNGEPLPPMHYGLQYFVRERAAYLTDALSGERRVISGKKVMTKLAGMRFPVGDVSVVGLLVIGLALYGKARTSQGGRGGRHSSRKSQGGV